MLNFTTIIKYFTYIIIFSLPLYLVRFSVFGVPTNVLEAMILVLLLLWLVRLIFSPKKALSLAPVSARSSLTAPAAQTARLNQNSPSPDLHFLGSSSKFLQKMPLSFFIIGTTLLLIGLLLSTFLKSDDVLSSLGIIKSWLIVPVIFYVAVKSVLITPKEKIRALWALGLSGVLVSVIGITYWLAGNLTYDGRLKAFYEHPNMLAMSATVSLIVILLLSIKYLVLSIKPQLKIQHKIKFFFTVFSFSFLAFSLYKSASLGAWLGIFFALGFLFFNYKRLILNTKYLMLFIIAAGILLPFGANLTNPWELGRNSASSRLMVWQASTEMIKDNWLLGIGPVDFQKTYLDYQKKFPPYLEWAVPHPHNIFMQAWLMGGILGIMGFVLILVSVIKKFLIFKNKNIQLAAFTIFLYLLIHGYVDNTLWKNDLAVLFWFLLALI